MDRTNQPSGDPNRVAREIRAFAEHESHPEPSVLAAYQARTLTEEEADTIQEHLSRCRHCAALVLDLEELLTEVDLAKESEEPSGERAAAAVLDFPVLPRRKEGDEAYRTVPSVVRWIARPANWLGVAAALLLATATYQVGRWQSSQTDKEPRSVQTRLTLSSSGSTRGVDEKIEEISLPETLGFRFPSETRGGVVQLEFRDRSGATVHRVSGGRVPDTNEVPIFLPRGSLAPGRYEILATFPQGPESEKDSTYRFSVAVR